MFNKKRSQNYSEQMKKFSSEITVLVFMTMFETLMALRQSQTMIPHLKVVFIQELSGFNKINIFGQLENKKCSNKALGAIHLNQVFDSPCPHAST